MDNNSMSAATIFITGISASGKSTLGKRLKEGLIKSGIDNVKLLDGEVVREELAKRGKHFGYSTDERNTVALEIAHIAHEYNLEGVACIVCSICHMKKTRLEMRRVMKNVMEVYLDCPVSVCAERDYKGNYKKAFRGLYDNFVGVTEPYQVSGHVELILRTDKNTIDECASILLEKTKKFLAAEIEKDKVKNGYAGK